MLLSYCLYCSYCLSLEIVLTLDDLRKTYKIRIYIPVFFSLLINVLCLRIVSSPAILSLGPEPISFWHTLGLSGIASSSDVSLGYSSADAPPRLSAILYLGRSLPDTDITVLTNSP